MLPGRSQRRRVLYKCAKLGRAGKQKGEAVRVVVVSCMCRKLPFNIPYPVPFKLLGDETKGWIDVTYLSPDGTFRLTRGNKVWLHQWLPHR